MSLQNCNNKLERFGTSIAQGWRSAFAHMIAYLSEHWRDWEYILDPCSDIDCEMLVKQDLPEGRSLAAGDSLDPDGIFSGASYWINPAAPGYAAMHPNSFGSHDTGQSLAIFCGSGFSSIADFSPSLLSDSIFR